MSETAERNGRTAEDSRQQFVSRGLLLAGITVAWNVIEGIVAIAAGVAAESVALFGFGVDSFIETASAAAVMWRLRDQKRLQNSEGTEAIERRAAKVTGWLLVLLASYLVIDAGRRLAGAGPQAEESAVGIALTAVSLVVMPLLARAKLRIADEIGSQALRADAFETIACAWLSATTLAGLVLNAILGWSWADPVAALVLVPLIAREGIEALREDHEHRDE